MSGAAPAVGSPFEADADRYDAWYDTPRGRAIFAEERAALEPLLAGLPRPWLEVGVGGGRFAASLGVGYGVDPAAAAVALARGRGVEAVVGRGEALPFSAAAFGAVLFVVTLCFVDNPVAVLREARRVLRVDGGVVLGLVLAEGPWGRRYRALAEAGHAYYRRARFFDRSELTALLDAARLRPVRARSALFSAPDEPVQGGTARDGDDPAGGFTAILVRPAD